MRTIIVILTFITAACVSCVQKNPEGCFPAEYLPEHITPLTSFGHRAEWSLDGQTVFFVDSAGGEIWKVDINTRETTQISNASFRPEGHGYYRILCLANGDYLLTCGPGRRTTYIQIWDKSMKKPPVSLDIPINEGPAVSRKTMKIAWTEKQQKMWIGEIAYQDGIPDIIDRKLIIDNQEVVVDGIKYEGMIEPQSFRPGKEDELIWSQYGEDPRGIFTSEVMGFSVSTGTIRNYSKAPGQYDEPEGIFPDGIHTLIECDHHDPMGPKNIDIYMIRLDTASTDYTRLTFFNEVEGFRASNPVVRDDGKKIAFQASISGSDAGAGCGLYIYDL